MCRGGDAAKVMKFNLATNHGQTRLLPVIDILTFRIVVSVSEMHPYGNDCACSVYVAIQ